MKAQGILTSLGTFLTRMPARESEFDHESSRPMVSVASREKGDENDVPRTKLSDAPTMPGVVIGSPKDAATTQSSQPTMVNPGPVLALLTMLRNRRPRSHRVHGRELRLPPGCVLAARYASR